jgi:phosphoenolpyruvate carboxylase
LIQDIRLLGRILGDVIREQEGEAAFALIEQIRQLSVAFRRDADHEADKTLKKLLKGLSGDQTVSVIRAFTYFSHLANLAEDRHHIRRRTVHERAGDTQEGSIDVALSRLRWAGIAPGTIAQTLAHSYVSPVLTAHPTEVQRKSILDAERDIASCWRRATTSSSARSSTTRRVTPSRRASWPPTRRSCAPASRSCGRRACCATAS